MKSILRSSALFNIILIIMISGLSMSVGLKQAKGQSQQPEAITITPPDWVKNANIYEVNIRQFTPEGTFKTFIPHMQRLKDMGIDILWIMPIHPIGMKNRKGSLGSYYSVQDYFEVNPELGQMEDFKLLVNKAHGLGLKVIIDWVANHCAWDNQLVTEFPQWFAKDENGNLKAPFDWTDVVQFDYSNKELNEYMWGALEFWVKEINIDGYRCDVADMVPVEFWNTARQKLDRIKPVFLLAEAENPKLIVKAFDMDYGWGFHGLSNAIAQGKKNCTDIDTFFAEQGNKYPKNALKMNFSSNHDENSWQGTEYERYGEGAKAMAVLMATVPGMPLVYSGQEAPLQKRLKFFERDPIDWADLALSGFYKSLLELRHRNKALWNLPFGGDLVKVKTNADQDVYAFVREKDGDKVFVVLNLSGNEQNVSCSGRQIAGNYREVFTGADNKFSWEANMVLKPWSYKVFEKINKK